MHKLVLITVIFFILGAIITYNFNKNQLDSPGRNKVNTASNPLNFITGVKTLKGIIHILIGQDNILFRPFEDMDTVYKSIDLKKEAYPKLFHQGEANFSAIQADEYIDPQTKEIFIRLTNLQPDHGGYAGTYVLLVNPFTGEIKEGESDYSKWILEDAFSVSKGDYWIYEGTKKEDVGSGKIETSNIQKRIDVTSIQETPRGKLITLGGSEASKLFVGNFTIDFDPDKLQADQFILKLPLKVGQKWGDNAYLNRDDGFYVYQVEEKLSEEIMGKKFDDCFKISFKTNADSEYKVFCYGLGIVEEDYKHNGTVLEWNYKLVSSNLTSRNDQPDINVDIEQVKN